MLSMNIERDTLPSDEEIAEEPAVIVAAHPDDEVIGLGTRLSHFEQLRAIVHITDGAPRNGSDIRNAGKDTWQQYADVRRAEMAAALEEARCKASQTPCFWCPDQRAVNRIASHARRLASLFERLQTRHVFTHPYEGGHPDHDAVAASVNCAATLMQDRGSRPPLVLEFASYHASPSGVESECFLNHAGVPLRNRELNEEQRMMKQRLFRCYRSQQNTLAWFPIQNEPIRLAPLYDFSSPPHEGQLLYETFDWGFTSVKWCRLAAAALRKFSDGLSS